jgi:hypothetical protein
MGIEWLAETLGEAKEVQGTEPVRRVGWQTVGHSGILIGTDRCNGSSDSGSACLWTKLPFRVG